MKIALKIDVDTYRGTVEGVPRLVALLTKYNAGATFLFSLGADHTGRAIKRVFRPGFFGKVSRTSVVEHYGIKTLLYGTLLPGPDIGRGCAGILRDVAAAGFETGIHTWDHVKWQDGVGTDLKFASNEWTEREMRAACTRYQEIFGAPARTHGAAGWQMNRHALRLTQRLGFDYCSDTRGSRPFIPVVRGELMACPQIPSTLPTLDELIGLEAMTPENVHQHILKLSQAAASGYGHVYTLHAELEGMKLLPVFERLLQGWRERGDELVATRDVADSLDRAALPHHNIVWAEVPGRSGVLATQGPEFLPAMQQAA